MDHAITVCTGHRCAALLQHAAADALPCLRSAVRASDRGVLISTGCVGACAQAPVVALSTGMTPRASGQDAVRLAVREATWLGPVGLDEVHALCAWVGGDVEQDLPPVLGAAVFMPT